MQRVSFDRVDFFLGATTPAGFKGYFEPLRREPGMQAVRCTRFLDRENLAGYRARLRFNERAAAELLEQATALMAQAKSCHDELETYYRTTVDFAQVDEAAARCAELFGLEAPSPDC